jgi:hypothetical protein
VDAFLQWVLEHWNEITVAFLLFIILIGGSRKHPWWVFGWLFAERTEERDEWKRAALKGTNLAKKAMDVAEKKVSRHEDN